MKLTRYAMLSTVAGVLLCSMLSAAQGAVVTVDPVAKSATSDAATIDPIGVKVAGDQVGVFVKSTILKPQQFTLKYAGLKDADYDVYVNGDYRGAKNRAELEAGIELGLEGTVADPVLMRCIRALDGKIEPAYKPLQGRTGQLGRAVATLVQAAVWVRGGVKADQAYRSDAVIVVPAGTTVQITPDQAYRSGALVVIPDGITTHAMMWLTRRSAEETRASIAEHCAHLQEARSKMYTAITDRFVRDWVISVMTPVEFTGKLTTRKGKPHVDAMLVNNCNLPISTNISLRLPSAWKCSAKALRSGVMKSGKTYKFSFDLLPTAKGAVVPDRVPMVAYIVVSDSQRVAKYNLEAVAKSSVSEPKK